MRVARSRPDPVCLPSSAVPANVTKRPSKSAAPGDRSLSRATTARNHRRALPRHRPRRARHSLDARWHRALLLHVGAAPRLPPDPHRWARRLVRSRVRPLCLVRIPRARALHHSGRRVALLHLQTTAARRRRAREVQPVAGAESRRTAGAPRNLSPNPSTASTTSSTPRSPPRAISTSPPTAPAVSAARTSGGPSGPATAGPNRRTSVPAVNSPGPRVQLAHRPRRFVADLRHRCARAISAAATAHRLPRSRRRVPARRSTWANPSTPPPSTTARRCPPTVRSSSSPRAGSPTASPSRPPIAELEALMTGPANGRDNIWWVSAEVIEKLRERVAGTK